MPPVFSNSRLVLRNAVTSRIQGARCNGSVVLRTRSASVPSTPPPRRHMLNHALSAAALRDTHAVSMKGKGSRELVPLSPKACIEFAFTIGYSELHKKTPVACNTGVTRPPFNWLLASQVDTNRGTMKISKHIDYLGMTYPSGTQPDETGLLLSWRRLERAFKGYQFAMTNDDTGAVWLYNIGQSNMGAHLQLSGNALSQLRMRLNCDDFALMRQLTDWQGRASRIDLAINFHGCKMTALKTYRAFKADEIKTPARSADYIEGIKDGIEGMTCYIGVRQSERYVRVYDKNAQMKKRPENIEAWTRMEIEMKKLWARAAQNSIVQHGTEAAINSHFSDFIAWNNREYNDALTGTSAPIEEIGRKESAVEQWLMRQVVPSLARTCHANPSFLQSFMAAYRQAIKRLQDSDDSARTNPVQSVDID